MEVNRVAEWVEPSCRSAVMFVLWLVQLRTGNAAIVDAGWTFSVAFSHLSGFRRSRWGDRVPPAAVAALW